MNIFQFGGDIAGKIKEGHNGFKTRWSQTDVQTMHLPEDTKSAKRPLATDVKFYYLLQMMEGIGHPGVYLGKTKNGYVSEIKDGNGDTQVCYTYHQKNTWNFKAGVIDDKGVLRPYEDTRKGTIILLSLMREILSDSEAAGVRNDIRRYLKLDPEADDWDYGTTAEHFGKLLCIFTNNVYYRITRASDTTAPLSCELTNIKKIRQDDIKKTEIVLDIIGKPSVFPEKPVVKKEKATFQTGKYLLNDKRTLSFLEQSLIPIMPDSFVTPLWIDSLCAQIQLSNQFQQPFRMILLTGPSGTGKTTGTKAMAAYLGLPYVKITCSPDTDIFDFIGTMIPNVNGENENVMENLIDSLGIPSFEDVENDFEGSYLKLFHKPAGKMSGPSDCYAEITKQILSAVKNSKDFTYVESDLIKAVRNGYFCEIQEPTVIKRSSVMVGLNSIMESEACGASYTLPTGEVIKKHPDCVICLTTNSDYEGCNMIQQSVLSRMDIVREIPNPTVEELRDRTIAQTGFTDVAMMHKMAEIIRNINEFCKEKDITDGICGPRELANWAKMTLIISKMTNENISDRIVCQAAFTTLINKVSQDKDDAEAVITGCLKVNFSGDDIEEARMNYEEGLL